MSFTQINLAQLPAPNIVQALDYETILAAMLADLQARDATFTALVESDPAYKVLEVAAYRELILRQRVNDAARGVMLAYALRSDLDNLAANLNVQRLLITAADPDAIPPVEAVYEGDTDLRARVQLAFEGLSTAGPVGSYKFHGLSADGDVADIGVEAVEFHMSGSTVVIDNDAHLASPQPGNVAVTVLSRTGTGAAGALLLAAVEAAVNDDKVRPLTDRVVVRSAAIVTYAIDATLTFYDGPSSATVLQAASDAVDAYQAQQRKIGYDITRSGLFAALHQPGVQNVVLTSPAADVVIDTHEAAYCTGKTLTNGGVGV
ncbi:baseplate J/gp47 family protein [Methylomonas sp. EFPC1]|uniref:baseplate assembly protein n=1 Tax=Methylomonas sp. EFPC1 TaxID=2812647 RepID=UPI0019672D95|nr:baseplate J/gp47 family protein [Methylomonas sp. EFPC1]QSB03242.1 baseplate J/gp47 family protein [Methylomonas sp. EFPC1]